MVPEEAIQSLPPKDLLKVAIPCKDEVAINNALVCQLEQFIKNKGGGAGQQRAHDNDTQPQDQTW